MRQAESSPKEYTLSAAKTAKSGDSHAPKIKTANAKEGKRHFSKKKLTLPGGESNPGLPRDRRGYLPLYYRGLLVLNHTTHHLRYCRELHEEEKGWEKDPERCQLNEKRAEQGWDDLKKKKKKFTLPCRELNPDLLGESQLS